MKRSCIEKKVREVLKETFQYNKGVKGKTIAYKTSFIADLDFETSDMVEFLYQLDRKFGIRIRKSDDVSTFGTLVHSIMIGVTHRRIKP